LTRIVNGCNTALNTMAQGTVPDVSGALQDRFQLMVFTLVATSVVGFQALQLGTEIAFQGNIQPFRTRDLQLIPEGQRSWSWYWVHALPGVNLATDDVVQYNGAQYRVMAKNPTEIYGYLEYQLVEDWTGSGPEVTP
jgi:hypothetical protein